MKLKKNQPFQRPAFKGLVLWGLGLAFVAGTSAMAKPAVNTKKKAQVPQYDSLSDEYLKATAQYNQFIKSHSTASSERTKEAKTAAFSNFASAQSHEVAKVNAGFLTAAFKAAAPKASIERQISKLPKEEQASAQGDIKKLEKLSAKNPEIANVLETALKNDDSKQDAAIIKQDLKQPLNTSKDTAATAAEARVQPGNNARPAGSARVSNTGVVGEKMESAEAQVITLKTNEVGAKAAMDPNNPLGTMEAVGGKPSDSGGADSFSYSIEK